MLVILSALVDGLLIRAAINPEVMTPGLTGKAFVAMAESAFGPAEAPGVLGDRTPRFDDSNGASDRD